MRLGCYSDTVRYRAYWQLTKGAVAGGAVSEPQGRRRLSWPPSVVVLMVEPRPRREMSAIDHDASVGARIAAHLAAAAPGTPGALSTCPSLRHCDVRGHLRGGASRWDGGKREVEALDKGY